jgi:hypothetical protein
MTRNLSVLLVANQSHLGDGLEKLLVENALLNLYRASSADFRCLLDVLFRRGPVVMIVEWEAFGGDVTDLVQLLKEYNGLQIIILSSESNKIQVYACYQTTLPNVNDLTTLILEAVRPAPKFRHRYTAVSLSDQLFFLSQ